VQNRIDSVKTFLENLGRTALFFEPQRVLRDHTQTLDRFLDDLETSAEAGIQNQRLILERFTRTILARSPERKIADMTNALEQRRSAMNRLCSERQKETQATLSQNAALLKALNPTAALARGYTLTLDQDGHVIRSASQIQNGQTISTRFHDGSADSKVLAAQVNSHPTA
jgi:exodeoxyribonuclease VII large subunit